MKTPLFRFSKSSLWIAAIIILVIVAPAPAQNPPPTAPNRPVSRSSSVQVRGVTIYSINFPGGRAAAFFDFLRTNGFAADNVLFAGRAGEVRVPPFTVKNVRLKDIAKALELLTEGRLNVEVVEEGEQSDVNIWRIKMSEATPPLRTKTCAMPNFFSVPGADKRIAGIIEAVASVLVKQLDMSGRTHEWGSTHTLESEKIVVVVGPEAYVEAVSSALEAAEKVAAGEALLKR